MSFEVLDFLVNVGGEIGKLGKMGGEEMNCGIIDVVVVSVDSINIGGEDKERDFYEKVNKI